MRSNTVQWFLHPKGLLQQETFSFSYTFQFRARKNTSMCVKANSTTGFLAAVQLLTSLNYWFLNSHWIQRVFNKKNTEKHAQTDARQQWPNSLGRLNLPTFFCYQFHCWVWSYTVWNIFLANSDQLSPFPSSCWSPAYLLVQRGKRKPSHYANIIQHRVLSVVINAILVINPNHSTVTAAMKKKKKVNSIPIRSNIRTVRLC